MARTQATKVRSRGKSASAAATQVLEAKTAERTEQATATSSTQLIEQQQSTEVVQSLIHGSISCLAYLRNLFPEGCFEDQLYDNSATHWPYENYAAGNNFPGPSSSQASAKDKGKSDPKAKGTLMRVLRRGRNAAVDTLLDWLEKGAFEALRRGHLRAIQLNIFEDANNPANVVETYTFTFNYVRSPDRTVAVVGIEMSGPKAESVTIKNAKYAMQMFIRRLIALCGILPDLPSRRYLNMHLFYTDDCDPDYEPPGFGPSDGDTVYFPDADWKRETTACGTMDAGFHAVSLKVSYLRSLVQETGESDEVDRGLPVNLAYTAPVSRESDIQVYKDSMPMEDDVGQTSNAEQANVQRAVVLNVSKEMRALTMATSAFQSVQKASHRVDRYSTTRKNNSQLRAEKVAHVPEAGAAHQSPPGNSLVDDEMDLDGVQPRTTIAAVQESNGPLEVTVVDMSASSDTRQSQPPDDVQIKKKLERMLEPTPQQDIMVETQQTSQHTKEMDRHLKMVEGMPAVELSQRKMEELDGSRNHLLPPRDNASSKRRRSVSVDLSGDKDVVSCQCGWNEDEDDMINCSFCDNWQHLHCYGYCGSDDPRIPVVHACYNCLLGDKEAPLLSAMKDLALQRRGMHIIEKQGFTNDRDFSTALRSDLQTANRLVGYLRKQGYVIPAPGAKKKGSKSKLIAATAEPIFSQMMREYFDPMTKVSHHFMEMPQPQPLPLETNLTTQFTETQFSVPTRRPSSHYAFPDTELVFDPMETDPMETDPMETDPMQTDPVDETQDDAMGQLTPKASSSSYAQLQRIASQASRLDRQPTARLAVTQVEDSQSSQSTRYALRQRTANAGATSPPKTVAPGIENAVPVPQTPGNKRGREDERDIVMGETPAERAKRLKISMSQSLIDIGDFMTPSPAATPARHDRF